MGGGASSVPVSTPTHTAFYQIGITIPKPHYTTLRSIHFPNGWPYQWYLEFGDKPMKKDHIYLKRVVGLNEKSPKADFKLKIGNDVLNISWPAGHNEEMHVKLPVPDFRTLATSTNGLDFVFICVTLTVELKGRYACYAASCLKGTQFAEQFKTLLASQIGADVAIVPNDGRNQLTAHWPVLAARSEYFAGVHRDRCTDCKEKHEHTIELDLSFEGCKKLLQFVYTDQVEFRDNEDAQALLKAGDKYLIEDLKITAENYLRSKLNEGNALDFLTLSHLHKAVNLKKEALDCLAMHPTSATENKKFLTLLENHEELVAELLVHVPSSD